MSYTPLARVTLFMGYNAQLRIFPKNSIIDTMYNVKIEQFEGPLDLLLELINKEKMDITNISLAQIADHYLDYLEKKEDINIANLADFLTVAAKLILIKSKSLLPTLNLTNEEEVDIKNLEERLKLFELYSNLSLHLKNNFGKKIIFTPQERKHTNVVFLPDNQITKDSMMVIVSNLINQIPKKSIIPEVEIKKVISLEEMIDKLKNRIQDSLSMNFREFSGVGKAFSREERVTVIVGFLAMLELVREGILHVIQDNNFEDILIEKGRTNQEEEISDIININN
jgi:segregation and condensation protein A